MNSRSNRAFTLAEVLAALTLMAIVIPVAIEGMSMAARAGELGRRKAIATRIAERVLHEAVVDATTPGFSGTHHAQNLIFEWEVASSPWDTDALDLVTARVTFELQGQFYDVELNTLVDPAADQISADEST